MQVEKSDCEKQSYRRRLASETNEECYGLETSNDDLYDCIPDENGGCIEVPIDNSKNLKLSIIILCLLFLI